MFPDRSPLTGLPGNRSIAEYLNKHVISGEMTAVYVDIENFKPFNDHYGFALGDAVIRRLAMILSESVCEWFTGHIGGDDFICAGSGSDFFSAVEEARHRFRSIIPGFYTKRDRAQGGIEAFDRRGSYRFFPMLDVTVVPVEKDQSILSLEELAAAAGRKKKLLKGEQMVEPIYPVLDLAVRKGLPVQDMKALIESCGILREEKAVPVLSSILTEGFHWNLRKSAALALGHIGNTRCAELLLESLKDRNPHVRTRSVEGLVLALGSSSGPVIGPLSSDCSTWVRRAVFRGIGRSGWTEGANILEKAAVSHAHGRRVNTIEERRAALEGISMLGLSAEAELLFKLCGTPDYQPAEAAFEALCAVGTDMAADMILNGSQKLPAVLNTFEMSRKMLKALEELAVSSLEHEDTIVTAVRFFEGYPHKISSAAAAGLKKSLGSCYGELFRRVVMLLDKLGVGADRSCTARIASRLERGQRIGDDALCAFLGWISRRGGVSAGALLKSYLRTGRRPVAAAAAMATGVLVKRGLDDNTSSFNYSDHSDGGRQ
ncbi:hypothetical protein CSA37_06375 [Candidatus Fermentibacteria bacterium]|nr:MAG: hypothetical protein CSA37_06375 [Candidatus Fermentibacteria bacterium]